MWFATDHKDVPYGLQV